MNTCEIWGGLYGHSLLRESFFGGTTQAMLEQTGVPVLFGP